MKFSPSKHFWTWFKRNSQTLLEAQQMNQREQQYWLHEITAHLKACSKKLSFMILWDKKGISRFIISARGNTRYFPTAEKFVAKAPDMPGWEIIGLQPPNLLPKPLVEEVISKAGIMFGQCWMYPPDYDMATGKARLRIFAEAYPPVTNAMIDAIHVIVCNLLGEKIVGLEIEYIDLESIFSLDPKEKKLLIKLEDLPAHIRGNDTSGWEVNINGKMHRPRHPPGPALRDTAEK